MKWFICIWLWFAFLHPEIHVQGNFHKDDFHYIYGSHDNNGYLLAVNQSSEEILFEVTYEEEFPNVFMYLADVGDYLFVINRTYLDQIVVDTLIKYDFSGSLLDSFVLEEPAVNWHNHHHLLVLDYLDERLYVDQEFHFYQNIPDQKINIESSTQYQGDLFLDGTQVESVSQAVGFYPYTIKDGDYIFSYALLIQPLIDIMGSSYKDGYHGDVVIYTNARILFQDQIFNESLTIQGPGIHQVHLQGYNYEEILNIIIYPQVNIYQEGDGKVLSDNQIFHHPIYIFSQADELLINGEIYNGGLLSKTGYYQLETLINNDVIERIFFKIEPMVEGLENQGVYDQVSFYVFGQAKLNGEDVEGFVLLDEPGQYHLEVFFDNNMYERYDFDIINKKNEKDKYVYVWLAAGICVLGLTYIYLKK
jgi:hypothetical protein